MKDPLILYVPDERKSPVYQGDDDRLKREWDAIKGRSLLERLRYKGYVRAGTLGRFMQRLGDWGREHFPFIGRGWDGFGRK